MCDDDSFSFGMLRVKKKEEGLHKNTVCALFGVSAAFSEGPKVRVSVWGAKSWLSGLSLGLAGQKTQKCDVGFDSDTL